MLGISLVLLLFQSSVTGTAPRADRLPLSSAPQRAEGKVEKPGNRRMDAVSGVRVTLHRVGPDAQGPIDSVVTDRNGRYAFRYLRTGSPDAVYFLSASHDGIAYFSNPLE